MGMRISGGETMKTLGKADSVAVSNLSNQKEPMSSSPFPSWISSVSDSVIDPVKEEEFDWVAVEREAHVITDKAPEIDEVEDAFSALPLLFNDDDDDDDDEESENQVLESEFVDWIEPPLQLRNARFLQPYMLDRLYDAFHLFQTDPSVQRMVMSLASDKAVWDAVMNNEVVRELITNKRSEEESCSAANCIQRIFERSAVKIIDAMERVTKYVTQLFTVVPEDDTVVLASGAAPVMEKLQMTVLLAIVVLLIVLVTRATRGR